MVTKPLCSFGHGTAGIAFVFNLLGKYFKNEIFKSVSNKAYLYINKYSLDNSNGFWKDYRKNINSKSDLDKHVECYNMGNRTFFKEIAPTNHSISHGTAGIAYSLLHINNVLSNINGISDISDLKDDLFDIAHLYLELNKRCNSSFYFTKFENILQRLKQNQGLDLALLYVSIIRKQSCHLKFPKIQLSKKSRKKEVFFQLDKLPFLLAYRSFPETTRYLRQLSSKQSLNSEIGITTHSSKDFLSNWVDKLDIRESKREVIEQTFEYERELDSEIRRLKQNPFHHIAQFIAKKERIRLLKISDDEMLKCNLTLSNKILIKKKFVRIDKIQELIQLPKKIDVIWKYDCNEGIVEWPMDLMGFIIYRFNCPRKVNEVLKEVIDHCKSTSEIKIEKLVKFSGSRSKLDLIERLPFLFIAQTRLLVVEGILEFGLD